MILAVCTRMLLLDSERILRTLLGLEGSCFFPNIPLCICPFSKHPRADVAERLPVQQTALVRSLCCSCGCYFLSLKDSILQNGSTQVQSGEVRTLNIWQKQHKERRRAGDKERLCIH